MSTSENVSPQVLQILSRELRELARSSPTGIKVLVNHSNITDIQADIEGPDGTPYEGGLFRCKLVLGNGFPNSAPRGFFLTKIFHPNVAANGDICVNTLKKDWKPTMGLRHILQVIRCLLIVPFPESALNQEASKLFIESYADFVKRARLLTSIHGRRHAKPQKPANSLAGKRKLSTSAGDGENTQTSEHLQHGTGNTASPSHEAVSATASTGKDKASEKSRGKCKGKRKLHSRSKSLVDKRRNMRKRNLRRL